MKKLTEIIRAEMVARGVLTFARFMELALYCPVHGYYETQKDNVGVRGDFYTSVSTGGLFGELLAFQFARWLEELRTGRGRLRLVEVGAHDGRLAKDILTWLQTHRPELFAEIEYLILEPSPLRQAWQQHTLKDFSNVRWHGSGLATLDAQVSGVIFSNELLDAMPVHRYGWDANHKKWFEWGVVVAGDQFGWAKIQNPEFKIQNPELESVLPNDYTIETSPAAENWWSNAAKMLQRGKLLAIDYGHTADEIFSPSRLHGTLRAYFRHQVSDDLLANVGEQDLTAHVNFTAIQQAGEAAGLTTESFVTQPQFLTQILGATMADNAFGEWFPRRTRQFQTLTHPEHLGRAFRVLVQVKAES